MGREGVLPRKLGTTHPRWKTPWISIMTTLAVWVVLVVGVLLLSTPTTESALAPGLPVEARGGLFVFAYMATLATPMIMLAYLLLGIAGIRKGQVDGNNRLMIAGVLATLTGALAVFGSLYYSFKEAAPGAGILPIIENIPWINIVLLIAGIGAAVYLKSSKPKAWADMGSVFE
jgi:amino acid transporter